VEFMPLGSGAWQRGLAKRVSLGGMFIETDASPAIGGSLFVIFSAPDRAEPMFVPGTVRWTNASGVGIQFGPLGARETHTILEIERALAGPAE
jgi:Tfp pilus assembly protein PilZ